MERIKNWLPEAIVLLALILALLLSGCATPNDVSPFWAPTSAELSADADSGIVLGTSGPKALVERRTNRAGQYYIIQELDGRKATYAIRRIEDAFPGERIVWQVKSTKR